MVHECCYTSMSRLLRGLFLFVFLISALVFPQLAEARQSTHQVYIQEVSPDKILLPLISTIATRTARPSIHRQKVKERMFLMALPLNAGMVPTVLAAITRVLVLTMVG